jgi:hypothetical protein
MATKNDPDVVAIQKRRDLKAAYYDAMEQAGLDAGEMAEWELSTDKMMTDLREARAIRAWDKHLKMVESMHEFIDAVIQMREIGMPHGNDFEDSHFKECLEFAKRFLAEHRKMET